MINIPLLDNSPNITAKMWADIHVIHYVPALATILSSALHTVYPASVELMQIPSRCVTSDPQLYDARPKTASSPIMRDTPVWMLSGLPLLPPVWMRNPWVKWAAESRKNAIWLFCMAMAADREREHRFGMMQSNDFKLVQAWQARGLFLSFSKDQDLKSVILPDTLPPKYQGLGTLFECHQARYRDMRAMTKMHWTVRPMPDFMAVGATK